MQDNPFEPDAGISGNTNDDGDVFIPFDTTGTIVSFESRVPTEFEMSNLPVIVPQLISGTLGMSLYLRSLVPLKKMKRGLFVR